MIKEEICCECGEKFLSGGVWPQHRCDKCQMKDPPIYYTEEGRIEDDKNNQGR